MRVRAVAMLRAGVWRGCTRAGDRGMSGCRLRMSAFCRPLRVDCASPCERAGPRAVAPVAKIADEAGISSGTGVHSARGDARVRERSGRARALSKPACCGCARIARARARRRSLSCFIRRVAASTTARMCGSSGRRASMHRRSRRTLPCGAPSRRSCKASGFPLRIRRCPRSRSRMGSS